MVSENKELHKLVVEVVKEYIRICEENHLRYYFTGGSLIGVVRHEGFIPWDDDVDIVMPRKDFDRFHEIISNQLQDGYGICNRFTDSTWHFGLSQFFDSESEVEINLAEKPRKAHVWVDIFPVDGLPDGKIARWIRVKNVLLHRYFVQLLHINTQVDSHRKRPLYERIILEIFKKIPLSKVFDSNRIIDHMEKVLRKSDFDSAKFAGNMLGRYREKEVVLKKYFGQPQKGKFETIMVNIPENTDALLTEIYGDYMKLPPVEQRVAHNVKIIKSRDNTRQEK